MSAYNDAIEALERARKSLVGKTVEITEPLHQAKGARGVVTKTVTAPMSGGFNVQFTDATGRRISAPWHMVREVEVVTPPPPKVCFLCKQVIKDGERHWRLSSGDYAHRVTTVQNTCEDVINGTESKIPERKKKSRGKEGT